MGHSVWRSSPLPYAHTHQDIELNYVFGGTVTYLHGSRVITVPIGRLVLFWAGIPHRIIRWSEDAKMTYITIPLEWFLAWDHKGARRSQVLGGLMLSDVLVDKEWKHFDAWCVSRWLHEYKENPNGEHECIKLEISARIHRLLKAGKTNHGSKGSSAIANQKLSQALEFISEYFNQTITTENIAQATGYHPNYLQNLFKKTYQLSLWDYITHYRISQAQRMLVETDWPVTTIALESGFGSSSSFYRAFEKINAGESPVAFRHRVVPGSLGSKS